MSVLLIDDDAREKVRRVTEFAKRPGNWYRLGDDGLPRTQPPGSNPQHICQLNDFICVFSYTREEGKDRLWRHLAISVKGTKYANPFVAYEIAQLFEFTGWDGQSDAVPDGWLADVNPVDRCITFAQQVIS